MLITYPSLLNKIKEAEKKLRLLMDDIKRITPQWEKQMRDFEDISHRLEEAEKERVRKSEETKAFEALIAGKKTLLESLSIEIQDKEKERKGKLIPNEKEILALDKSIVYLKSLLTTLETELDGVADKRKEKAKLIKDIEALNKDLAILTGKINESNVILKENIAKSDDVKANVLAVVNQAKSQVESAENMLTTVDGEFRRVEFYARRLKKLYQAKGWPIPEDLGDFQAQKVNFSHKTIQRMKDHVA
jgi:chromosome segregation ATPase